MSKTSSNQHHDETVDSGDISSRSWLIAIAAPRELDAVLSAFAYAGDEPMLWQCVSMSDGIDLVWTGVGKANASGAVARVLDPNRHLGVLSVGIAGALPGSRCKLGDVVCASSSIFGDEGIQTPGGFESCAQMGFSPFDNRSDSITHDPEVIEWLSSHCDHVGPVACVSICSGTDPAAAEIAMRTSAIAEAMEGASASLACYRVDGSLRTGELRVISNTTGDRERQLWDLDGALHKLTEVLGRIADGLR